MFSWPWWITAPVEAFYAVPWWVWVVLGLTVAGLLGKWVA